MGFKLGLKSYDDGLLQELLQLLVNSRADYCAAFRRLSAIPETVDELKDSFICPSAELEPRWTAWLQRWRDLLRDQGRLEQASASMLQVNPAITWREWLVAPAYQRLNRAITAQSLNCSRCSATHMRPPRQAGATPDATAAAGLVQCRRHFALQLLILSTDPVEGLMHSLRPGLGCESMAVAMARKQPGHIQGLQAFERTDLHVEIPPAVPLGTDQHLLLAAPPDVIAAEQHTALIPQQQRQRTGGVTGSRHQLQLRCQQERLLTIQDLLRSRSGM